MPSTGSRARRQRRGVTPTRQENGKRGEDCMKIPLSKTEVHDKKDFVAKVYVTKSQDRPFNALLVEVLKRHYKVRLKNSTRLYFVIKGNGTFTVDGKKEKADLYDCFVIKHGQVEFF